MFLGLIFLTAGVVIVFLIGVIGVSGGVSYRWLQAPPETKIETRFVKPSTPGRKPAIPP